MICVFPSDATDFASNGLCVLMPTSCSVTETLNGEWELSMTHPLDERDKWTYVQAEELHGRSHLQEEGAEQRRAAQVLLSGLP